MNRFGALRQLAARKGDGPNEEDPAAGGDLGGSLARAAELVEDVVGAAERAAEEIRAEAEAHGEGRASVIDRERLAAELMKSLVERTDSLRSQAQELARILERAAPLITGGPPSAAAASDPASPAAPPASPAPPASSEPSLQTAKTVVSAAGTQSQPPPAAAGAVHAPPPPDAAPAAQPPAPEPAAAAQPDFEPEPEPEFEAEPERRPLAPLPPLTHSRRDGAQVPSEGIRLLATQMAVAGSTQVEIEERLRSEFGVADANAILAEVFGARG